MDRNIRTVDDVLRLLDRLFAPEADRWTPDAGSCWWDSFFYSDRFKPAPFFVAKPDENLVVYAKLSLRKYRPIAARNEDKKVFSGLL